MSHIQPCLSTNHVVVVTSPRSSSEEGTAESSDTMLQPCGGYILIYAIKSQQSVALLQETPVLVSCVADPQDAVMSLLQLPCEVNCSSEDEASPPPSSGATGIGKFKQKKS